MKRKKTRLRFDLLNRNDLFFFKSDSPVYHKKEIDEPINKKRIIKTYRNIIDVSRETNKIYKQKTKLPIIRSKEFPDYRSEVCKRRKKRREILFVQGRAGHGKRIFAKRYHGKDSDIRC